MHPGRGEAIVCAMQSSDPKKNAKVLLQSFLLASCLALCLAAIGPQPARAEHEVVDGVKWVYELADGKAVLNAYAVPRSTEGTVMVPARLGGCPVTEVGDYAFFDCGRITRVVLPKGVTRIGEHAFQNCTSLESVELPDSLEDMEGFYIFMDCTALKSVSLPPKLEMLGGYAFFGCSALESVAWPESLLEIGQSAFSHCTSLKEVRFPPRLEKIRSYAFCECDSLRTLVFPESLAIIQEKAFYSCTALQELVFPESLESIGDDAFLNTGLKCVTVLGEPEGDRTIWGLPKACELVGPPR